MLPLPPCRRRWSTAAALHIPVSSLHSRGAATCRRTPPAADSIHSTTTAPPINPPAAAVRPIPRPRHPGRARWQRLRRLPPELGRRPDFYHHICRPADAASTAPALLPPAGAARLQRRRRHQSGRVHAAVGGHTRALAPLIDADHQFRQGDIRAHRRQVTPIIAAASPCCCCASSPSNADVTATGARCSCSCTRCAESHLKRVWAHRRAVDFARLEAHGAVHRHASGSMCCHVIQAGRRRDRAVAGRR